MSIEDITIQDYRFPRQEYRSLVFGLLSLKHHSTPHLEQIPPETWYETGIARSINALFGKRF